MAFRSHLPQYPAPQKLLIIVIVSKTGVSKIASLVRTVAQERSGSSCRSADRAGARYQAGRRPRRRRESPEQRCERDRDERLAGCSLRPVMDPFPARGSRTGDLGTDRQDGVPMRGIGGDVAAEREILEEKTSMGREDARGDGPGRAR